jgi:hypothetical protein
MSETMTHNDKETQMTQEPRPPLQSYRYATLVTPSGRTGRLAMFIEHSKDVGTGVVSFKVAPAFCSPNDGFTKARGRAIASGRFEKHSTTASPTGQVISGQFVSVSEKAALTNDDVMEIALTAVMRSPIAPNWAMRSYLGGEIRVGLSEAH